MPVNGHIRAVDHLVSVYELVATSCDSATNSCTLRHEKSIIATTVTGISATFWARLNGGEPDMLSTIRDTP